jgi:predicted PurR-regulated permease PerM
MNIQGAVVIAVTVVLLVVWILNLVRIGRLYVGYAVLVVGVAAAAAVAASLAPLRRLLARGLERLFPSSGMLVVLVLVLLVALVYLLTQLTILSNRLATLTQELAISAACPRESDEPERRRIDAARDAPRDQA